MRTFFLSILFYANATALLAFNGSQYEIEVKQVRYMVADSLNSFYFITLRNISEKDVVFWVSDKNYKTESQEEKVHDFFYGRNCTECWPLLHILYETGKLTQISWKNNFIKCLPKSEKFTFVITNSEMYNEMNLRYKLENEIVFENSEIIDYYGLRNYEFLYPYDFIVIDAQNF